ncbi:hypothetical protein KC19_VG033500 [Ceratodon purpureus]|uniref:Uncharacterized protein n=1 Tax=Ceratodon purpureus TaxID=3225 RepID=A0A8T0HLY6_CERPU|nr:hypothetical protein KC19_VG033500 [Ceratodon purpureus]
MMLQRVSLSARTCQRGDQSYTIFSEDLQQNKIFGAISLIGTSGILKYVAN